MKTTDTPIDGHLYWTKNGMGEIIPFNLGSCYDNGTKADILPIGIVDERRWETNSKNMPVTRFITDIWSSAEIACEMICARAMDKIGHTNSRENDFITMKRVESELLKMAKKYIDGLEIVNKR